MKKIIAISLLVTILNSCTKENTVSTQNTDKIYFRVESVSTNNVSNFSEIIPITK